MHSARPGARRAVATAVLRAAFPHTIPILAGFVFLGITCGIYAGSLGLPWWVPTVMSVAIFAGSAEFVVASQLAGAFDPVSTFAVVFIVNARHLFYGLSMLERLRGLGRKRPYLIFGMCDETFSITYATEPPKGIDHGWFMFWVTLLNQLYWVAGCTLGGIFGTMVATNIEGVSFAMTALFVVIFLDQWEKDAQHLSAAAGIGCAAVALLAFGADAFMIPAMVLIIAAVTLLRGRIAAAYDVDEGTGPGVAGGAESSEAAYIGRSDAAARKGGRP